MKRWMWVSVFSMWSVAAIGSGVTLAHAGEDSGGGIVRDGIDTQSNTREGIDTDATREGIDSRDVVKDGIDRSHDKTGINDEGIDRGDLDDDTERPDDARPAGE